MTASKEAEIERKKAFIKELNEVCYKHGFWLDTDPVTQWLKFVKESKEPGTLPEYYYCVEDNDVILSDNRK